jgi:ABC-2 type transport system permease protein
MTEHAIEHGRAGRAAVDGGAAARRWSGLAWRQYRLERKMFWRNPTAAFFNFFLPLLFLALFGAIFSGNQHDLDVIVPGIAGMSIMATTFSALVMNVTFLREQGVLKRLRGTPLDVFGYSADRRLERNLIAGYEKDVALLVDVTAPADAKPGERSQAAFCV